MSFIKILYGDQEIDFVKQSLTIRKRKQCAY